MKISKLFIFYKRVEQNVQLHLETKLKPSYAFYNYIHIQNFEANEQVYLFLKRKMGFIMKPPSTVDINLAHKC